LFDNFLENPKKIYLAVEIKRLDDELFGDRKQPDFSCRE